MINYDLLIFLTSILIPSCNKLLCNTTSDVYCKKMISVTMSQYTNWNLVLIAINTFYKNSHYEFFITINSITICIVYHIFRFTEKENIRLIPNIPKNSSFLFIDFISFFVHVLPPFVYIHHITNMPNSMRKNIMDIHNIGYDVALFQMGWALQSFESFNPGSVYYYTTNIYKYWCFSLLCHICGGYILQTLC